MLLIITCPVKSVVEAYHRCPQLRLAVGDHANSRILGGWVYDFAVSGNARSAEE
jgi:hypothetical protein